MDSSRGISDTVDFITGRKTVRVNGIQSTEWVAIIRSAAKELPMGYLRGMKNVRAIIHDDSPEGGVPHTAPEEMPPLYWPSGVRIGRDTKFLCIGEWQEFPDSWEKAPMHNDAVDELSNLRPVYSNHYLLSKKAEIYLLHARWTPHEDWDDDSVSSRPAYFSYELDTGSEGGFTLSLLPDKDLRGWMFPNDLPKCMLYRMLAATRETHKDLRGQSDHAWEKGKIQESYLQRLGLPV